MMPRPTIEAMRAEWLAILEREKARRDAKRAWEEAAPFRAEAALRAELEEMASRMASTPRPGQAELVAALAAAEDWARIDKLRVPHDHSRAECIALISTVDQVRAAQLLEDVQRNRGAERHSG